MCPCVSECGFSGIIFPFMPFITLTYYTKEVTQVDDNKSNRKGGGVYWLKAKCMCGQKENVNLYDTRQWLEIIRARWWVNNEELSLVCACS